MARLEITTRGESVFVRVALSRRNLLALLAQLDLPGSARTIINNDCFWDGARRDPLWLILQAEDDIEHYARRPDPPGPMGPRTETFVREHGGWSADQG